MRAAAITLSIGLTGAAAALLACGDDGGGRADATAPDAAAIPLVYSITSVASEPDGRPARSDPPAVYIDDVAQASLVITYPDEASAFAATHRVELRAGSAVLRGLDLRGDNGRDCLLHGDRVVVAFGEQLCEYDSGDLRLGPPTGSTATADGLVGACIIDGSASCAPPCTQTSCGSGMRCASLVVSHAPLYTHLGCAPTGPTALGSACTFTPTADGDYDSCGADGACVAGLCHQLCGTACDLCGFVEGEPFELGFCQ